MFLARSFLIKSIIGLSVIGSTYAFHEDILATEVGQKIEHAYKMKYVYYYRTVSEIKYYITGVKDITKTYSKDLEELKKNASLNSQDSEIEIASEEVSKKSGGLTQYVEKSRDAARLAHLVQISTALGAYFADHIAYPETSPTGCLNDQELNKSYFSRIDPPTDPVEGRKSQGCSGDTKMTYAYKSGKDESGDVFYVLAAEMENQESGNSSESIDTITPSSELKKGSGKMFYIVK